MGDVEKGKEAEIENADKVKIRCSHGRYVTQSDS